MQAVGLTTARERARTFPERLALSVDARALAALGGLACLLTVFTWQTWGNLQSDTGYDFVAGVHVAHGQLPYVDFLYYYGPLPAALLGAAAWVGGGGIASFVVLGLLIATAIVGLTYVLGRRLAGPLGGFLAAAITLPVAFAPNLFNFVLPYSTGATLGLLTILFLLVAVDRAAARGTTAALLTAGAAAGLVALTKPEFEAAALAAVGAWLIVRARSGARWQRESLLVIGPALLVPAAVYGAFLGWVSPHQLFLENLYPKAFLADAGNAVLRARLPLTASSGIHLAGDLVLYGIGIVALLLAARFLARSGRLVASTRVLIAGAALVAIAATVVRPELLRHGLQFAYAWIPLGILVALLVLFLRYRRTSASQDGDSQLVVVAGVALAVLAASEYAAFYLQSSVPQIAAYTAPLAAIFIARLHLRELGTRQQVVQLGAVWLAFLATAGIALTIQDAHAESATVRGPGGAMRATPAEAHLYGDAVQWLDTNSSAGDAVLVAPQLSWMYAAADRSDPLPEISLLPGVLTDAGAERAAIRRLEESGVRAVIIDPRPYTAYGHSSFGRSFDRLLAGWIHTNFVHRGTLRAGGAGSTSLELWLRRGT